MGFVLVIDDEPTIRRLVASALALGGKDAITAPDAETAIDMLEEKTPDVIITDIRLPGMSGIEFAEKIRDDARFCEVPVAFISAWEEPPKLAVGAPSTYFRKPFDVEALVDWVANVTH